MIRNLIHITLVYLAAVAPSFAQVPSLINYQGKIAVEGVNFNGAGQFKFALVNGGVNQSQNATAAATVVNGFVVGVAINSGGAGYSSAPSVTVSGVGSGAQLSATVSEGVVTSIQVTNPGSGYQAGSTTLTVAPPSANLALTTYWSNDGSSSGGSQPTKSISLPVSGGAYSVLLGDAQITNMLPIPVDTFKNDDVRLRVWFSDGINGFQLMTPDQRISAVGYAMMAANVPDETITTNHLASGAVTGPKIAANSISTENLSAGAVTADKLTSGAVTADKVASGAVTADKLANGAVSTASAREGNVLLTATKRTDLENEGFVLIGVLNNTTLRPISGEKKISIPTARKKNTAIWTGAEMVIWGGDNHSTKLNTGGRYNPTTDSWRATNASDAPVQISNYTTVWTGTEMIIWGGVAANGVTILNTGARYNPTTDSWAGITTIDAPVARTGHAAVWTGTKMIVWGGTSSVSSNRTQFNTGGCYNPTTDTWTTTNTTGAPVARQFWVPSCVWTGTEMIIWGGYSATSGMTWYNTGGRYNPTTDSWRATNTSGAPASNFSYTTVWTGAEMILWGSKGSVIIGTRYNPATDSWTAMNTTGAPTARSSHTAIWTGTEMIIWGGDFYNGSNWIYYNTGARYNPTTDSWTAMNTTGAPAARSSHTAIWTGTEMIVWGGTTPNNDSLGNDGGRYNPTTDSWLELSPIRDNAIWTGTEMIVWGGSVINSSFSTTGARYNTSTDVWAQMSTVGAPTARNSHTSIWTGTEMIIWGGSTASSTYTGTGGRYNPSTDTWTATSNTGAPLARSRHTAIWTGTEMIVWGGADGGTSYKNGGRYNPTTNTWTAMSTTGSPFGGPAIWTGTEMIIWGSGYNTGARYNPMTDTWTAMNTTGAPDARAENTAVWTGTEMIIWGGSTQFNTRLNTGGRYNPTTNTWTATNIIGAPSPRRGHSVVWTGTEMIIWGGADGSNYYRTGARYNPTTNSWSGLSLAYLELRETMFVRQSYASEIWNVRERFSHSAIWTGSSMLLYGGMNATGNWAGLEIITPGQSYLYSKP